MQIRERGSKVHLVRTIYRKRRERQPGESDSFDKVLGTFDRGQGRPDGEVLAQLTERERAELDAWLTKRDQARDDEARRERMQQPHVAIDVLAADIEAGAPFGDPEHGPAQLWAALDKMRRVLRAAGHQRPEPTARSSKKPDARQLALDAEAQRAE